jgi:ParB-like chromosome segregation protein Spo0J
MNSPQELALTQIDLRFSPLRLAKPEDLRRLQESVQADGGIRNPVLVSTHVEPKYWVLVDGFKRLHVAQQMRLTHLWVLTAPLDTAQAKAQILHCNQPWKGLCTLEEAWLVHSLCDQGLPQKAVAELLKRDESWVSRRMKIAKRLDQSLQDDVRQGLLSTTAACNLSQLQQCNQRQVAQAARDHHLSSGEISRLVREVRKAPQKREDQAVREVLQDPWRYSDAAEMPATYARDSDSRLSQAGGRLERSLQKWLQISDQLTYKLGHVDPTDVRILAHLVQDAVHTCKQVLEQLDATHRSCSVPLPSQGERVSAQDSQPPSAQP